MTIQEAARHVGAVHWPYDGRSAVGHLGQTLGIRLDAALSGQPLRSAARQAPTELETELSRLRAENATLGMEREILKKATAFFAKESS